MTQLQKDYESIKSLIETYGLKELVGMLEQTVKEMAFEPKRLKDLHNRGF